METQHEMRLALNVLRGAQSFAIQSVKRNFPSLYALSARALETMELGSMDHHKRLGEYLTEWSNSLGKSPIEALALGSPSEVHDDLAKRAGIAPALYVEVEMSEAEPTKQQDPLDESRDAYMAFRHHYATGEGERLFVGVASSREGATETFLQNTPDYYHRGMEVAAVSNEDSPGANGLRKLIPQLALDTIASNPPNATTFYATLHYN